MLNTSIARVARSASYPPSTLRPGSLVATCQLYQSAIRPTKHHQRRLSSSKASLPPNGSSRGRSAAPSQQQPTASASGRTRGKKTKPLIWESQFGHLPSVPSTQDFPIADVNVSSFFSLHRPISVTTPVPPSISLASFSNIFETKPSKLRHQPVEVMRTVGSAVQDLEQSQDDIYAEENGLETQQDIRSGFVTGIPRDLPVSRVGDYVPFVPPPAPDTAAKKSKRAKGPSIRVANDNTTKDIVWMTEIYVRQRTKSTGQKVFSTTSTPLRRVKPIRDQGLPVMEHVVVEESAVELPQSAHRQPFLNRMRIRQKMYAISVKRQRKLKMKKHKYKKLMKRTRNLRRKLGKI